MLAKTYGPKWSRFPCFVQPKLNGVRALYQDGIFQSREERIWHTNKLAHLRADLSELKLPSSVILDGELYVHGWRLQKINGAVQVNSATPRDDTHLVQYCIFDVVDPTKGFGDRFLEFYELLCQHKRVRPDSSIFPVPSDLIYFQEQVEQHLFAWTTKGFEGIMLRPVDGVYEPGSNGKGGEYRSASLWKYKHWEDAEFLCVAVTQGDGKASIGVGALVCITQDGASFHVGTGFTDEDRVELLEHSPVGKFVKVRFNTKTADGIPQPAAFMCVMS